MSGEENLVSPDTPDAERYHERVVAVVAGRIQPVPHALLPVGAYLPTFLRRARWWVAGRRLGVRLPGLRASPWATAAVGVIGGVNCAISAAFVGFGGPPTFDLTVLAVATAALAILLVVVARPRPPDDVATWDALERVLQSGPHAVRAVNQRSIGVSAYMLGLGVFFGLLLGGVWWAREDGISRERPFSALADSESLMDRRWLDRRPEVRAAFYGQLVEALSSGDSGGRSSGASSGASSGGKPHSALVLYRWSGPPSETELAPVATAVRTGQVDDHATARLLGIHESNGWPDDALVRASLETELGWATLAGVRGEGQARIDAIIATAIPFRDQEDKLVGLVAFRGLTRVPEPIRSRLDADAIERIEQRLAVAVRRGADR